MDIFTTKDAKAESLIINSVGHRPMERNARTRKAPKGRYQDDALSGLGFAPRSPHRALPCAIDDALSGQKSASSAFCNQKLKNQKCIE
jgi:hypothetical protein